MDKEVNMAAVKKFEGDEFEFSKMNEVVKKFKDEFKFSKMDTMIHRFPPGLGGGISSRYPSMVVPRFVAIGPYHHGKKHLEKMEDVKKAAVYYLCSRIGHAPEEVRNKVLAKVEEARKMYIADGTAMEEAGIPNLRILAPPLGTMKMKDDDHFAAMMLCDACFLLLYMDAYNRSYDEGEDKNFNKDMRRFLFSNRDSINNDIMLLENQVPWLVIQVLMDLVVSPETKSDLEDTVGRFIARMGNLFKIQEPRRHVPAGSWWVDENIRPAHLLALLREFLLRRPDKTEKPDLPQPKNPQVTSFSAISPMDLEEIGIKLTASLTEEFSDMGLQSRWLFSRLTLAPLSLSDTGASWLVNMAALEVCTTSRFSDHFDGTAVCSYLSLLAFFMVGSEDVRRLRKKSLLHGPYSDDDMLAFFNTVVKHLPDCGKQFDLVMGDIKKYRDNRRIRTTLYKWLYNNYVTIIKVVTVLGTLIGLYQAFLSLVQKKN